MFKYKKGEGAMTTKVCPLIIRQHAYFGTIQSEVLLFRHPNHSIQVVKGTLEQDETVLSACCRELWEESGLKSSENDFKFLTELSFNNYHQYWHVYFSKVQEHRDDWSWQTIDDHGHKFHFFWCPLTDFSQRSLEWNIDQRCISVVQMLSSYLKDENQFHP